MRHGGGESSAAKASGREIGAAKGFAVDQAAGAEAESASVDRRSLDGRKRGKGFAHREIELGITPSAAKAFREGDQGPALAKLRPSGTHEVRF